MKNDEEKRIKVFEAAADVFAQYGFRRTSMNDIARAAGISRPALYLSFDNKEHLFRELAAYRQNGAIDAAVAALAEDGALGERMVRAVLAYEALWYEPTVDSPHGEELMDMNLSIAGDDMRRRQKQLIARLSDVVTAADERGEVDLARQGLSGRAFCELLMASVWGMKKVSDNTAAFRRRIRAVAKVFMASIEPRVD